MTDKNEILVVKRDGSKEMYDVSKIKKSIQMAAEGLDVNPLELESRFDQFLKSGIKTRDIQLNVIQHAIQLATPESPDWVYVAGRALAMDEWANFPLRGKSFKEIVQFNIKKNNYSKDLLNYYTDDELEELGAYIKHNRDLEHSYASLITAKKKYLGKFELNQHMHMVNAMRFGQHESNETRIKFVKEVYNALSLRKISLATPFLSNLRKGGNVASCFIIAIDDDLDSIFDNVKRIAKISKNGGGLGVYLGKIRAKGSTVNGYDNAAGSIVQWVKIINDTLVAVNQGGLRAGAATVALPIWHADILDFLDMQTEHGGDILRTKAFDVFPQICMHDIFMERDKEQKPWTLFCPFEVKTKLGINIEGKYGKEFEHLYLQIEEAFDNGKLKVGRKIKNARELMKTILSVQIETGLPYISYVDTINEANPNKNSGYIPCVNLCTESFSNVLADEYAHTCNLLSINVGVCKDINEIGKMSRLACRILNSGIELTDSPIALSKKHNNLYRTIGIGVMGLHDMLARDGMNFRDVDFCKDIAECIEYNAVLESMELSKILGPFEKYDGSGWQTGETISRYMLDSNGKYDWSKLQENINLYGVRNALVTSPAPTTSTSIYMDASASVLPVYDEFFKETNKNGSLVVAAKYLRKNPLSYAKTFSKHTASEIISVVSAMQKFITAGCSMELIFDHRNPSFEIKDIWMALHYAHEKNIKAVYYIRSIKKTAEGFDEREEEACVACSG